MPRRTHRRLWTVLFAFIVTTIPPSSIRLSAWGAQGHHIVARIAWAVMTPAAREGATRLLGGGVDAFVAAATWADEVEAARPESYNWHFVDIPFAETHYDPKRDCPSTEKGDCVIAAIARARAELVEPGRSMALKGEALKFLLHFVGDLHQPLHTVDNHDRGGNDVRVVALRGDDGRGTNLHAVWDTGLINLSDETESARAQRLTLDLTSHPVDVSLDAVKWAEEGHDIGVRHVYRYPGFSPTGPGSDAITLDDAYRSAAAATIDRQLQSGGARLGALLNTLIGRMSP